MPPRTGQLDQISEAIGRVDAYVHEYRHGIANIAQQINGMELAAEKRHATLKIELKAELRENSDALRKDLAGIAERVTKLEEVRYREDGARSVKSWLIDHSPWATLAAIGAAIAAWWRPHL